MMPYARGYLVAVVVLQLLSQGAGAQPYSTGVDIITSGITPNPVEPGSDLTLTVRLTNQADFETVIDNLNVIASKPFVFKSSQLPLDNIRICRGCSYTRTLYFTMDPEAVSGTYSLTLVAASGYFSVPHVVEVKVVGKPNLGIEVLEGSRLDSIAPNDRFNVTLAVKNRGSGTAKEIAISPVSKDFIPLGSGSFFADALAPGGIRLVTVDFLVSPNLKADSYAIPLAIAYKGETGDSFSSNSSIGVKVINSGRLDIQSAKIASAGGETAIYEGMPFLAVVRIENVGYGDVTSVTAELNCPFGRKKSFLGKLEKEEDAPVVFDMKAAKSGKYECLMNISYSNDMGEMSLSDKMDIEVERKGVDAVFVLLAVMIAAAFLALFFRKRVEKGNQK